LSDIKTIVNESEKKSKKEFELFLIGKIDKEFKKEEDDKFVYDLINLNYDDPKTKMGCSRLLLLLNVIRYVKDKSQNKFPFDLFHLQEWSLEHINPQNPKEFENIEQFKNWLLSIESFFEDGDIDKVKLFTGEAINKKDDLKKLIETDLIKKFLNNAEAMLETHSIGNLALLDRVTNSILSNRPFLEKRGIVLDLDRKGLDDNDNNVYIPICTRDLFTKTFTYLNNNDISMYFTAKDMADYKKYITEELANFLPKQTKINGNV
jgi:hypothetical protein